MSKSLVAALLILCAPVLVSAQARTASPVDDLLDGITADINDLRYDEAVRRGRALSSAADDMPIAQRSRWRLLMAAAFYPEERALQQPDSATRHLRALIRLAPDARYAAEMRWRGLDSLLESARIETFAAVVRGPRVQRAGGADEPGRVDIVASRGARLRLDVVNRSSGRVVQSDSAEGATASLRLLAHDDRRLLLAPGEYDLVLTAHDTASRDAADPVTHRYTLTVEGEAPELVPEPPLPASSLLPERVAPAKGRLIAKGLAFAGLTFAFATVARNDATLRDRFPADTRALLVGGAMIAGVGTLLARQKERPIPANIAANAEARRAHDLRIEQVITGNRQRLVGHAATVRITPEPR